MALANAVNAQTAGYQSLTSGGIWNGRTFIAGTGISLTNADGTAGNTTISATGSMGGLGTVSIVDDFMGVLGDNTGSTGNSGIAARKTGGGAGFTIVSGTAVNPGLIRMSVESGSNPDGCMLSPNLQTGSPKTFVLGNGEVSCSWIFKLTQLSTVAQTFLFRVGLMDQDITLDAGATQNGCWFQYTNAVNSGNWTINCANGGTTTTANTSTAASTSFINAKVIVNAAGTSASFYINGTQVANSPIATNLPTNPISFMIHMVKTNGSNAVTCDTDLLIFNWTLTTPRPG